MMKTRRTFTAEFKAKAVLSVLMGEKTASEICREHQLKDTVFSRWKQQFLEQAPQVFQRGGQPNDQAEARIAELEQVIGRLTVELEIAKKASLYLGRAERRNAR
jgi:transposase